MDVEVARWLTSAEAAPWLERARAEADPGSLASASRLRRGLAPERAAAVLDQAVLWRRAAALGRGVTPAATAPGLRFLTGPGLEQATRPPVARWRADRLVAAGAREVADLGCGLGLDALALLAAGLGVVAVERDPSVAVLASANLGLDVVVGEAEQLTPLVLTPGRAMFCDPARRTARGRSWDVADLSPAWDFVLGLLDGRRTACVKLGPGVPHRLLPAAAAVTWVSHEGDAVEASLWAGAGVAPGRRSAVVLPTGDELAAGPAVPPAGPVGRWLVEPDPAVIRSGAAGTLAHRHGLWPLAEGVAYLTGAERPDVAPFGTTFEIVDVLPFDVRRLRAWVREREVGTLEIKKRGVDVDPAALRRQLKPEGAGAATLVLTPTAAGARALVVRRA